MNKVAAANPDHFPALKALCEEAGIELPKTPDDIRMWFFWLYFGLYAEIC